MELLDTQQLDGYEISTDMSPVRLRCVAGVLVAAILFASCSPVVGAPELEQQAMASALRQLRDPSGFFVDPVYFDSPGSAYSTALLQGVLRESPLLTPSDVDSLCESDERDLIGEPWFSWAMARLASDQASCVTREQPEFVGDPRHDLPVAYAWVEAQVRVRGEVEGLKEAVRPLLEQPHEEESGAYAMWRQDQIERLLHLPSTALQRIVSASGEPQTPEDLMDLWGGVMRCNENAELCSAVPVGVDASQVAWLAVALGDDVSLAAAFDLAGYAGDEATRAALERDVRLRRVGRTGLVRQQWFSGTMEATFHALVLAPDLFPGPDPQLMLDAWQQRWDLLPAGDVSARLRALAILKAVDPARWELHRSEVERWHIELTRRTVTQATLHGYLRAAAAYSAMNLDPPQPPLELFPVEDRVARYDALVAVGHAWAFSNDDDLLRAYREQRANALAVATQPHEPVMEYVAELQGLHGPDLDLSPSFLDDVRNAVARDLRGCDLNGVPAPMLYRFTLDPVSPCSLGVTVQMSVSGFGS